MKVAIMGAGLSGLSCALTLEKYGIQPTIFERRTEVDDRFINGEIFLSTLTMPIKDSIKYFSEEFGIFIQPIANIGRLIIFSENEKATIDGHLGFSVARGRQHNSISKQIANQVNSKIIYNSEFGYSDLINEYTHVILATGDGAYSENMKNYNTDFTVSLKGSIVVGKFDPYTTMAWLDNNLAPKGYGYLIPLSENEANIVIGYPDYPENNSLDSNILWDNFFNKVQRDLNQNLKVVDNFQITRYLVGHCKKGRIGNTFFVGNCHGSVMPFLGFGQFEAITTGVYAAYDLCGKGNYEQLVSNLNKSYNNSLILRKAMEKLDNKNLDMIVKKLNGYIGNKIFDCETINPLAFISNALKPFINIKK